MSAYDRSNERLEHLPDANASGNGNGGRRRIEIGEPNRDFELGLELGQRTERDPEVIDGRPRHIARVSLGYVGRDRHRASSHLRG